ncbi:MAG: hypothetical protein Q8O89_08415, partial [Nanoarchaeota archaeon]|nr:hypothetical protein [Nanoarchaeota archaeon]
VKDEINKGRKMKELEHEFIEIYKKIGENTLQDDLLMTIYAIVYLEPEEISLNEIATKTGYSLASISNKAKILESMDIIKKGKKPGSKKIYLSMEKNMFEVIKNALFVKETKVIATLKEKLPELIKKYKDKTKSDRDKKKIKILEDYNNQMIKLEKLIQKVRKDIEEENF